MGFKEDKNDGYLVPRYGFGVRQGGGHEYPRAKGDKTNTQF